VGRGEARSADANVDIWSDGPLAFFSYGLDALGPGRVTLLSGFRDSRLATVPGPNYQ
jgi:hypothetical protein